MTANGAYQFDVEDVEYLRHGDKPLLARIFKPRGSGAFPLMVSLHGGAWCREGLYILTPTGSIPAPSTLDSTGG